MSTIYYQRKLRKKQKESLRFLLEECVDLLYKSPNPTFDEYINLDIALRCSGVFDDIDRVWVLWGSFAEKYGWKKLVKDTCYRYCN